MGKSESYNKIMNHLGHFRVTLDHLAFFMDILMDDQRIPESIEHTKELLIETIDLMEPKLEEIKTLVGSW